MRLFGRSKTPAPAESKLATSEEITDVAVHAAYLLQRAQNSENPFEFEGFRTRRVGDKVAFVPETNRPLALHQRTEVRIGRDTLRNLVIYNQYYYPVREAGDEYLRVTSVDTLDKDISARVTQERGYFDGYLLDRDTPFVVAESHDSDSGQRLTAQRLANISAGLGRIANVPPDLFNGDWTMPPVPPTLLPTDSRGAVLLPTAV